MKKETQVKTQSVVEITGFVLTETVKGVVVYISLFFFKPIWEKLVKWWTKNKTKEQTPPLP